MARAPGARTHLQLALSPALLSQAPAMVAFFDELKVLGFVDGQNLKIVAGGFGLREDEFADVAATLTKAAPDVAWAGSCRDPRRTAIGHTVLSSRCRAIWSPRV